ncbi:MAG: LL-diaminopimelate aminotransferase [Armatimonadetes bacterium CG2_30_59_28]|nr:aminotransferase class I/II-fold pyridoxal phosphate-dependent enzyme [Armatimonadota bacterium]OIO97580.1 MAG: LL-diaminopimelate aminotransferase [Armatimonadetes bacterium CG2_30_59_28]PIU65144.1 MAG: LL-diaminopimelate aminotransferase [Armatimonadetes bacterium CG07_land_8_20_14_0_80_59_28]PIX39146.1 MAG: LL-diaminopimelate aminotransferase [Armatimonadetes bacterium CG_4_8_14_3_um_filter_58_9]PIY39268.1 MAG: LL-diaminopimelate aminotransferase [Armatimonadetes bacterium CG_4_10_14_3_um
MQRAKRLDKIPPYLFAEIGRKIAKARAEGKDVISLGIGDPDQPTPDPVIGELIRAIRDPEDANRHRYGGDVPVREFPIAVAEWYQKRFGVELDPGKEVLALMGSKDGIAHIPWAFIDPGDIALVPQPGYPVYNVGTLFAGGESHFMPLYQQNGYQPDFDAIPAKVAASAKLMWLCYPNNPTTAVAHLEFFRRAVEFARKHDILICHDSPYSENTFDGYQSPSLLQVEGAKDVTIELNSLSKPYNMTGWRIAYAVGNAEALSALNLVKENTDSGILRAIQFAGVKALREQDTFVQQMNAIYQRRRDLVVDTLNGLGWNIEKPRATFYVWAPVPDGYANSGSFASELLDKSGVVVTPGRGYGEAGEGYFRISLTYPDERLREAMQRIADALR